MKLPHHLEQLAMSIAEYHAKHPCTKNYGTENACEKALDYPLTDHLRTRQVCYDCVKSWFDEWEKKKNV